MDLLTQTIQCSHRDTKRIYDVVGINFKRQQVEVIYTKINGAGTSDYIYKSFNFDDVSMLLPTGKLDDTGAQVMDYDVIVYGEKGEYTGVVRWNVQKLTWIVMRLVDNKISGETFLLADVADKYIHVVEHNYRRL